MKQYISANRVEGATDSARIQAAIALAKECGTNAVVIPRRNQQRGEDFWIIEETVRLPSDIEVLIDDAHLILAEGKYLNMFTTGEAGRIGAEDETKNVTLRGRGRATLDGGVYNRLHEKNCCTEGRPHISKNTTLLFFHTSGLLVENLSLINQRWWAITNIFVHDAVYRNVHFEADYSRIDENGVHYPDQLPTKYSEIYVKNADGIDLRVGCHDIRIENISGFTEDDSVALTALGRFERALGYFIPDGDGDIHDVTVKNVFTETCCANVRLLNDNGFKLYNVTVDGVGSIPSVRTEGNNSTVRIGDMIYAGEHARQGDTHHLTVRNVVSTARVAVSLCKWISDSTFENITVLKGTAGIGTYKDYEATLTRCRIDNVLPLAEGSVDVCRDRITLIQE